MAELTRSVTINAPIEKVFDLATDVGKFWVCAPDVAVRDVELTPDGVGSSARLWSHFLGFHMEGSIEYTEVVRPERIVARVSFGVEKPLWVFTFEPVDASTTMTGQGEWHVNAPAVGRPLEDWMANSHGKFLETLLGNFKSQVESAAG